MHDSFCRTYTQSRPAYHHHHHHEGETKLLSDTLKICPALFVTNNKDSINLSFPFLDFYFTSFA